LLDKLKKDDKLEGWLSPDEIYYENRESYIEQEILGFCGCGNPEDIRNYVKDMLIKLVNKEWGDYEDYPYMFFVYWANDKGFAEHGTTARCSWLTKLGKELLSDLLTLCKNC
jgi:hypothetical protein